MKAKEKFYIKKTNYGGRKMSDVEKRIKELGFRLPVPPKPAASYIPTQQTGSLIFTSGQLCTKEGKLLYKGKLGSDLTIEQGKKAARQALLNCLAVIKDKIKNLNKINKIVKVFAVVNSAPDFVEQPYVINGASDFLEEIFGEKGKHARTAISANELPFNTPVEIEIIVELKMQ